MDRIKKSMDGQSGQIHKRAQPGILRTMFPREYRAWVSARYRCTSGRGPAWKDYGGRGIQFGERWLNSFPNFLDDMGPCPVGLSLDRINVDGPYSAENCQWATRHIQRVNQRKRIPKKERMARLTAKAEAMNQAEIQRIGLDAFTENARRLQRQLTSARRK